MTGTQEAELVFIGGHDHIGGLQIALLTPRAQLFFDLGLAQTERAALFNSTVPVHEGPEMLTDYLRSGMAPLVENFYAPRDLPGGLERVLEASRQSGSPVSNAPVFADTGVPRAVFVGHLHSDHAGLLRFLSAEQTVYMSETSKRNHEVMVAAGAVAPSDARFVGLRHGETVMIGDIELTLLDTDHDTPGAAGFIARTADGSVAYTGDWRYHGLNPELMDSFARECAEREVDILLTEASTAMPSGSPRWPWGAGVPDEIVGDEAQHRTMTEREACHALDETIAAATGLVFICLHQQHFERVEALARSARSSGRRLVLTVPTARLWTEAARAGMLDIDPEQLLVLDHHEARGALATVSASEVASDRGAYLVQLTRETYRELLALGAGPRDDIIHANGHPLGSQYPGWETLTSWVARLGVRFTVVDSHGHVEPEPLRRFIEATRARVVVPVHSDHPADAPVPSAVRYLPSRWERRRLSGL